MPPVGFEPTISAGEGPKAYALGRAATGTGRMVTSRTLNRFEIRAELFSAVSSEAKCFFKAFTNRIRHEPVKREAEILKQHGMMTVSLKYPFFTQQDTLAFLVKIAEVHNKSHIKKFQSNLLIKKQRFLNEPLIVFNNGSKIFALDLKYIPNEYIYVLITNKCTSLLHI